MGSHVARDGLACGSHVGSQPSRGASPVHALQRRQSQRPPYRHPHSRSAAVMHAAIPPTTSRPLASFSAQSPVCTKRRHPRWLILLPWGEAPDDGADQHIGVRRDHPAPLATALHCSSFSRGEVAEGRMRGRTRTQNAPQSSTRPPSGSTGSQRGDRKRHGVVDPPHPEPVEGRAAQLSRHPQPSSWALCPGPIRRASCDALRQRPPEPESPRVLRCRAAPGEATGARSLQRHQPNAVHAPLSLRSRNCRAPRGNIRDLHVEGAHTAHNLDMQIPARALIALGRERKWRGLCQVSSGSPNSVPTRLTLSLSKGERPSCPVTYSRRPGPCGSPPAVVLDAGHADPA